jgi:uncharacterized protein YciI
MTPEGSSEPPTAEPPSEFDVYELVVLRWPEHRPPIDPDLADRLQSQHLGHLAAMKDAGRLKVAGPLDSQPDEHLRGICLYQVGSLEEARRLAESDPAVRAGRLAVEVMAWFTPKGTVCFPGGEAG